MNYIQRVESFNRSSDFWLELGTIHYVHRERWKNNFNTLTCGVLKRFSQPNIFANMNDRNIYVASVQIWWGINKFYLYVANGSWLDRCLKSPSNDGQSPWSIMYAHVYGELTFHWAFVIDRPGWWQKPKLPIGEIHKVLDYLRSIKRSHTVSFLYQSRKIALQSRFRAQQKPKTGLCKFFRQQVLRWVFALKYIQTA